MYQVIIMKKSNDNNMSNNNNISSNKNMTK